MQEELYRKQRERGGTTSNEELQDAGGTIGEEKMETYSILFFNIVLQGMFGLHFSLQKAQQTYRVSLCNQDILITVLEVKLPHFPN